MVQLTHKNVTVIVKVFFFFQKIGACVPGTPIGFNLQSKLFSLIEAKFSGIEALRPYAVATLLDPRFKRDAFNCMTGQANGLSCLGKESAFSIFYSNANRGKLTMLYIYI